MIIDCSQINFSYQSNLQKKKNFVFLLLFQKNQDDVPPYFKFMTVLAFNVFIKENVDVAIVEVGIGGEYDCTNFIRFALYL